MDYEVKACGECSRKCLLFHRGKCGLPPKIPPFFKVMFGKGFAECLFVPPKFSKILTSEVGRKAYLEDSTGKQWEVNLSKVNGSLSFNTGWYKFTKDHDLEQGDFLLFRYTMDSCFFVEIYGRSGYEKTHTGVHSFKNKIPKTTRNSITRKSPSDPLYEKQKPSQGNDCCNTYAVPQSEVDMSDIIWTHDDVNDVQKSVVVAEKVGRQEYGIERPQLVPEVDFLMEPCFMTDRESSLAREDDRERLLDLSALEFSGMEPSFTSNKTGKAHTGNASIDTKKYPLSQENNQEKLPNSVNKPFPSVSPRLSMPSSLVRPSKTIRESHTWKPSATSDFSQTPENYEEKLSGSVNQPFPSVYPSLNMPSRPVPPSKTIHESRTWDASAASGFSQPPPGGKLRVVKQEPKEFKQEISGNVSPDTSFDSNMSLKRKVKGNANPMKDDDEANRVVKQEPADFCDLEAAAAFRMTCLASPENASYLELPGELPMMWRQRLYVKQKLVILKDPSGRDWPVLYHKRNNINVLTDGWKEFQYANNILPQNECVFLADDLDMGEFRVQFS
ncbi:uncharacterized protein [Spinacia oleracea]|uniref:Uncharacterized protein isoform X2 n=1 Tax=Spinacia oleracea TaxID=3562 RepID=A0ABM3QKD0_SPIOL|nr:uncharacterized protein LOC110794539 isoform X2 [Spinacia oleracea]